jgi:hypothetical protein
MGFLLYFCLLSSVMASRLEDLTLTNLDLNYLTPHGVGQVGKLKLSIKNQLAPYPLEIQKTSDSYQLSSPYIDVEWKNPAKFIHGLKKVFTEKLSLVFGDSKHSASAQSLIFIPGESTEEMKFQDFNFTCAGNSKYGEAIKRVLYDCQESLEGQIHYFELPFPFLKNIAPRLPDGQEDELPANDFVIKLIKGSFESSLRVRYIFHATLRLWGHIDLEDEGKILAIRMDMIKYGIVPVTAFVMNELRREINHPSVTINPPWIRIKLDE